MIENQYFSGQKLYGDDLSFEGIQKWYAEEETGYFDLVQNNYFKGSEYVYEYGALNEVHAFRYIRGRRFGSALALGCARGDDVAPLAPYVDKFFAIEPAEKWWRSEIGGTPAQYLKPSVVGDIQLDAGTIDISISLAVLHHIPNVSHVIGEISRVSTKGALFVLREPISSMGDWRKPRLGLTKNERGLPLPWLDACLEKSGFEPRYRSLCMFPLTSKIASFFGKKAYQNEKIVQIDKLICSTFGWNYFYHRNSIRKKLGPGCIFSVLEKAG